MVVPDAACWLAKPWWGQGVMTVVVGQVTAAYGFDQLGLERLAADVFAFSLTSARSE
jgi:RimJ/RimL family protein N-acetyltransferase